MHKTGFFKRVYRYIFKIWNGYTFLCTIMMHDENTVSWIAMTARYNKNGFLYRGPKTCMQNMEEYIRSSSYDNMHYENTFLWFAMIVIYTQNGFSKKYLSSTPSYLQNQKRQNAW